MNEESEYENDMQNYLDFMDNESNYIENLRFNDHIRFLVGDIHYDHQNLLHDHINNPILLNELFMEQNFCIANSYQYIKELQYNFLSNTSILIGLIKQKMLNIKMNHPEEIYNLLLQNFGINHHNDFIFTINNIEDNIEKY